MLCALVFTSGMVDDYPAKAVGVLPHLSRPVSELLGPSGLARPPSPPQQRSDPFARITTDAALLAPDDKQGSKHVDPISNLPLLQLTRLSGQPLRPCEVGYR